MKYRNDRPPPIASATLTLSRAIIPPDSLLSGLTTVVPPVTTGLGGIGAGPLAGAVGSTTFGTGLREVTGGLLVELGVPFPAPGVVVLLCNFDAGVGGDSG